MVFDKYDPRKGELYQVVNEASEVVEGGELPADDVLKTFYHEMALLRALDDKAFLLQRQGRMGTYPQVKGAEAIQIGAAHAMNKEDWLVPSYREAGLMAQRGVDYSDIWLFWLGNEISMKFAEDVKVFPIAVPVGSQLLHAVGLGMAANIKKENFAILACCGDGATSEGEVHEAMNFAGVMKVPVVFLVSNNQFAISVPRSKQTASKTIAEKAYAYGFSGVQVDGMDVVAMHQAVREGLDRARSGQGPSLIEALTFRLCDHTTADNAKIYQNQTDLAAWQQKDGVARLKNLLEKRKLWTKADEENLQAAAQKKVEEVVAKLESAPKQTPKEIFAHTYATMPAHLTEQLEDLQRFQS